MTGPGEVERDRKGDGLRDRMISFAPSTIRGIPGDGGLLVADDWLLPELLFGTRSTAPSL